jgi:pyruvate formate lyase activating enzyme
MPPSLPLAEIEPASASARLRAELDLLSAVGTLVEPRDADRLACTACAHRCELRDGQRGICGVRFRDGATLRVPFGYVARTYVRAVETNTIFHVHPGARALTFGMFGCDLACGYCHNARVSQALRVDVPASGARPPEHPTAIDARSLAARARDEGCRVLCSAYNEPMISAEWAFAVFGEAKALGLTTALVSDGHTTPEALGLLRPVADVFRVDLKAATEEQYRTLGGSLGPVLAGIRLARELGYWVEVVSLVVPGFNDDARSLRTMARAIAAIDPDIPWHVNGFKPRFRMRDRPPTGAGDLVSAAGSGYAAGLRYVYVSNVIGAEELGKTRCPRCEHVLVERVDFEVRASALAPGGTCPKCAAQIPGVFADAPPSLGSSDALGA